MREDGGDPVAAGALDVHEVGVWVLHQPLQLVPPLLILGQRQEELPGKLGRRVLGEQHGKHIHILHILQGVFFDWSPQNLAESRIPLKLAQNFYKCQRL